MSYGFLEIDHLLTAVDRHDGKARYERLGFNLTPISVIANLGIANHLALFRECTPGAANFIELMHVVDADRVARTPMGELLAGRPGIRSMVLCAPDAQRTYEALARDGYPFAPPMDIEREWQLPDGEVLRPSFRVALPIAAPLTFNFCQYRTLQYYLRPAWLEHENGALHLTRVFALSGEPALIASYYEGVFGARARTTQGRYEVGPGKCQLCVADRAAMGELLPDRWLPPTAGAAAYVGYEVQVGSLSKLRQLLDSRKVEFADVSGAVVVAPHEACGNVLRFVAA